MIVEYATGIVHQSSHLPLEPWITRAVEVMVCGRLVQTRPVVPVIFCPCEYHKPLVAPTLPSNQRGCPGCFPDGKGWHPVAVQRAGPSMPPWPHSHLVDGS